MDDEAMRAMVREEAQRMRIRTALVDETAPAPPKRSGFLRQLAEHPAGRLLFGFILTGVIGQWLSWSYAERKEDEELSRASLAAIRDFSTIEQQRRQRYTLLRSAILYDSPLDIVAARKVAYDDAYVEWSSVVQAQRLRFREFFGYTRRHYLEAAIDTLFLPKLQILHGCIVEAELHMQRGERPQALAVFDECGDFGEGVDGDSRLLDATQNCAYEITSTLTHYVMSGFDCGDERWREDGGRIFGALNRVCTPWTDEETVEATARSIWVYDGYADMDPEMRARRERIYDIQCVRDDGWFEGG